MFYVSLMVTTKQKLYGRYTEDKEKGIKAYNYRKLSNHKENSKEGTKDPQDSQKIINKTAILSP